MLELLRAAAQVSRRTDETTLPDEILQFSLEYEQPPDIEVERQRIAKLLDGDGFDLFHFSEEDDPNILILQFQGVERQQSANFLFRAGAELSEELGLLSASPEIGAIWEDNETTDTESVGKLISAFCTSKAPSPADPHWARKMIRADKAAGDFSIDGSGIVIGQPDTGVAEHRELDEGLDKSRGFNFLDNSPNPEDPLLDSMGSPGHGTATSSVVISRLDKVIVGSAPGATVVPLRCVNRVVIGLGIAVARAIDHARKNDCHVITMSLGGPLEGSALRGAIKRAVDADMIVLAAAGNCIGKVVYPAWDENVIAVAGLDEHGKRWKGSSHGRKIDIAAPGENVHVARRLAGGVGTKDRIDERGQGTSYAVALTAGCAALWLERHEVAKIKAEAARRGVSVQELFRSALRHSANTPSGWDTNDMGAGILDAYNLTKTKLADIPTLKQTESAHPALASFSNTQELGNFATEAGYVAMDWEIRSSTDRAVALETALAAQPSPELAAALPDLVVPEFPTPAILAAPGTPKLTTSESMRKLQGVRSGDLESAVGMTEAEARDHLRQEGLSVVLDGVQDSLNRFREVSPDLVSAEAQSMAMSEMERALETAVNQAPDGSFEDFRVRAGLEALVQLTGRPAVRVRERIEMIEEGAAGEWAADIYANDDKWRTFANSVGRIDVQVGSSWKHTGTGFVIGSNLVMTNRHVLDVFAEPIPVAADKQKFVLDRDASIVFDHGASKEKTRFKVKSVVTAGAHRIGSFVDLDKLDMAIVEIESTNEHGASHPGAINLTRDSAGDDSVEDIMIIGYPAKPRASVAPSDVDESVKFWERIGELYGNEYGVKYLSPGKIMKRPGKLADDDKGWAYSHDATTMGGNSGSVSISLKGGYRLCGLHFGGATFTQNLAHDVGSVAQGGDGVFDTSHLDV